MLIWLYRKRKILFQNLNNKTSWDMNLYIPSFADFKYLKEKITNKNINLIVFNGFYARNSQKVYPLILNPQN